MKLLSVTNRYYFISITVFFILAGIVLFYSISYQLNEELNEQLITEQIHATKAMQPLDSLNMSSLLLNDNISFLKTDPDKYIKPSLFDSSLYDNIEKEYIPYRLIRFTANTKKQNYIVTLRSSKIEKEDIIFSVFLSLMLVFGLFSIMLYLTNYYFSKKLWSPFLQTIAAIKTLNINNKAPFPILKQSYIEEFNELNNALEQMIVRIKSDYMRMKDFSENASHELQTPLTVIRSKLESLMQNKDLKEEDALLINQALENTVRLSRINQTLILLTKIENRQYEQKQSISFLQAFIKYIELYEDMISEKEIKISITQDEDFVYEMHPVLADILVSNLLSNAVKHNILSGYISISMHKFGFEITNSGELPEYSPELLFTRFKKGSHSSEHLGLGLALVKEIASTNNLQVQYNYLDGKHRILLNLDPIHSMLKF